VQPPRRHYRCSAQGARSTVAERPIKDLDRVLEIKTRALAKFARFASSPFESNKRTIPQISGPRLIDPWITSKRKLHNACGKRLCIEQRGAWGHGCKFDAKVSQTTGRRLL